MDKGKVSSWGWNFLETASSHLHGESGREYQQTRLEEKMGVKSSGILAWLLQAVGAIANILIKESNDPIYTF